MPTGTGITVTTQPGFYNLFMYSCESTWANRGCTFTIDTNSQSCVNVTGTQGGDNYGPASERYSYVLGENMAIFTNVFVPSGVLNVSTGPSQSGSTANFNGMQLQFIQPFAPLAAVVPSPDTPTVKNSAQLTWAGAVLESSGSVAGPFTPVTVSGVNVTSPYDIPARPGNSAIFYIAAPTNFNAPGIPYTY
jgi:hypothetical protein